MQFYTSSRLSFSVPAQDVSIPPFSSNISFANTVQFVVISWFHFLNSRDLPSKTSIVITNSCTVTGGQEAASAQESGLIEQSLCSVAAGIMRSDAGWLLERAIKVQWMPVVKSGRSMLRTDWLNMLYQGASNLFWAGAEIIGLGRSRNFSKCVQPILRGDVRF